MKTLFCTLLISCLIVTNIYADDNDIEINRSGISETIEIERPKNDESRTFKIISGFCVNDIIGYDYKDLQGYDFGLGFRIGYGISIIPRLTLESTYALSFHESDTAGVPTIKLNAFDVNFKYVLLPVRKIGFYANVGLGLDLIALEIVDFGYFSYIPNFGAGVLITLHENFDLDLGFNVHVVKSRVEFEYEGKMDCSYLQFLLLLNIKL
jgi:opacity protein-like surface antigen